MGIKLVNDRSLQEQIGRLFSFYFSGFHTYLSGMQETVDSRNDVSIGEGLNHGTDWPLFHSPFHNLTIGVTGDDNYGQPVLDASHLLKYLRPVSSGHLEVKKYQIEVLA